MAKFPFAGVDGPYMASRDPYRNPSIRDYVQVGRGAWGRAGRGAAAALDGRLDALRAKAAAAAAKSPACARAGSFRRESICGQPRGPCLPPPQEFYQKVGQWLSDPYNKTYKVSKVFIWSHGSFDALGIVSPTFVPFALYAAGSCVAAWRAVTSAARAPGPLLFGQHTPTARSRQGLQSCRRHPSRSPLLPPGPLRTPDAPRRPSQPPTVPRVHKQRGHLPKPLC